MKSVGNNISAVNVMDFVNALNPMEYIDNIVNNILNYQEESKLIDAKLRELEIKTEFSHHKVDCLYKLEVKKIKESAKHYHDGLKVFSKELNAVSLDKNQVYKTLVILNEKLNDESISVEIRFGTVLTAIENLTSKLVDMSEINHIKLNMVFNLTMSELNRNSVVSLEYKFNKLIEE